MPAPTYQLTMRSGEETGKAFPLEQEETLVGRDLANDITAPDPEVSRRHARFMMRDDSVFVEDLGSTNGTFLNGERISAPQQLRLGDVITLGENVSMVFEKFTPGEEETMITPEIEKTPPPVYREQEPERQPVADVYRQPVEPSIFQEPAAGVPRPVAPPPRQMVEEDEERRGLPAWLIILIIAIVIVVFVIAVTMFFMPASWWCAIDIFNLLEGCPIQ
jgi:hypothetical protein